MRKRSHSIEEAQRAIARWAPPVDDGGKWLPHSAGRGDSIRGLRSDTSGNPGHPAKERGPHAETLPTGLDAGESGQVRSPISRVADVQPQTRVRGGIVTRKTLIVVILGGLASSLIGVAPAGAQTCTIAGSGGADNLGGTPNRDVICARGGSDRVVGRAGRDELLGEKGRDTIYGGARGDNIRGGQGNDVLQGQAGGDVIRGASGHDRLFGGSGRDALRGGFGNDVIDSSDNTKDGVRGGAGADTCFVDPVDTVTGCDQIIVS